jgi:hypothetical protein
MCVSSGFGHDVVALKIWVKGYQKYPPAEREGIHTLFAACAHFAGCLGHRHFGI